MNIRELNLFQHLAGTLHYGQTGRSCNITRSGLRRAIQRLEQEAASNYSPRGVDENDSDNQ